jgi:hypothetical protein
MTFDTVLHERGFADLHGEWRSLLRARRSVVRERWTDSMTHLGDEYADLLHAGKWTRGPADFFGIVRATRAEVVHSAMIAWLLDPMSRHGLGQAFLRNVLDECFAAEAPHGRVRSVRCEVGRGETRADIVVFADTFTLVIENKVNAPEGHRQCDRLYERFGGEVDARFVFLSPDGRSPVTATGEAAEAFATLSYRTVADCLEQALASRPEGGADGRAVAVNYVTTLEGMF